MGTRILAAGRSAAFECGTLYRAKKRQYQIQFIDICRNLAVAMSDSRLNSGNSFRKTEELTLQKARSSHSGLDIFPINQLIIDNLRDCFSEVDVRLVRADEQSGLFQELERQWREQCEHIEECFEEFAAPSMEHAREITMGRRSNEHYGIYILQDNEGTIEAFAHLNVASLPRTTGRTLRLLWVLLAPKYDYQDFSPDVFASLAAELFYQSIQLAIGSEDAHMRAEHVKIHLTGVGDRPFMMQLADELRESKSLDDVGIRGNWLHMSLKESLVIA